MTEVDDFLLHYGVRGMRWGVRRDLKRMSPGDRAAYLKDKDAKWRSKVEADPKLGKISAKASRYAKRDTRKLKQDYRSRGINIKRDAIQRNRYDMELQSILERSLDKAAFKVHKHPPSRLFEVQIHRHPDGSITSMVSQRHNAKLVKQQGRIARSDRRQERKAAKAVAHADAVLELPGELADYGDYDGLQFYLTVDDEGYVDDVSTLTQELEQMDSVGDFLAHYGVKGMKWGVRRSDAQLSGGSKKSKKAKKSDDDDDDASIADRARAKVGLKTSGEKEAEAAAAAKDLHISADAERFVKTRMKEGHEMSTREIQEALNRARLVQQYDDMFNPGQDPNAGLRAKVDALRLQKDYSQLKAEMNPSTTQKVKRFINNANDAYSSFQKLDNATGGALGKQIGAALGNKPGGMRSTYIPKHRGK